MATTNFHQERLILQLPELLLGPLSQLDLQTVGAVVQALPQVPQSPFHPQAMNIAECYPPGS